MEEVVPGEWTPLPTQEILQGCCPLLFVCLDLFVYFDFFVVCVCFFLVVVLFVFIFVFFVVILVSGVFVSLLVAFVVTFGEIYIGFCCYFRCLGRLLVFISIFCFFLFVMADVMADYAFFASPKLPPSQPETTPKLFNSQLVSYRAVPESHDTPNQPTYF